MKKSLLKYIIILKISKKFKDTAQLREKDGENIKLTVMMQA